MAEWINNNEGLIFLILVFVLSIFFSVYILINKSRVRSEILENKYYLPLIGLLVGSLLGIIFYEISVLENLIRSAVFGAIIGLLLMILILILRPGFMGYRPTEIKLSIPQFSNITFTVNNAHRKVAWSLFIETITRVSTQPLSKDDGYIGEALSSLHGLFQITRDLLKTIEPSEHTRDKDTVEMFAISLLNNVLRPFLSKWHPVYDKYMKSKENAMEVDWECNLEFRDELESLRKEVISYTRGFGELAGIENMDTYFKP